MNAFIRNGVVLILCLLPVVSKAESIARTQPYSEADMLPVRSVTLTPGTVQPRVQAASGLPALFLIGDDPRSRAWLQQRLPVLQRLKAVGLVVQVETVSGLEQLRRAAPGVSLFPSAADDLAQRLGVQHYPVLITATAIEQ